PPLPASKLHDAAFPALCLGRRISRRSGGTKPRAPKSSSRQRSSCSPRASSQSQRPIAPSSSKPPEQGGDSTPQTASPQGRSSLGGLFYGALPMPFNGSGEHSLPAGTIVADGMTVQPSQ